MATLTAINSRSPKPRIVFGSFLSAFLGWTVLNLYFLSIANFDPNKGGEGWFGLAVTGIFSAVLILGTWFVALLPLYLLVPLFCLRRNDLKG
jgi:hypothetical protein